MSALIALFDGESGAPRTLMEGGYVTDLRTGAGTGLAALRLARADGKVLTVVGAGRVARNQIEALCTVLPLERVFARTLAKGRAFAKSLSRDVELVEDLESAVRDADVLVTATTAKEPVLCGRWIKPGAFVAAVGAYSADHRELDDDVITRAS
jgi:alanine dehydrogenase